MYETVILIFSCWALVGFFGIAACPVTPWMRRGDKKARALLVMIVSGPIGWLYIIPISLIQLSRSRRRKK